MVHPVTKDERLYARFDINMDEHPKILMLSDAAFRALIESTLYARRQLTDGVLKEHVVLRKWTREVAEELSSNDAERPSWVRTPDGWRIHDFEKHQTTSADIQAKRAAGRLGGLAKAGKRVAPASDSVEQKSSKQVAKTETETEAHKNKNLVQAALERDFDEFWSVFPRKEGKQAAKRKYATVRRTVSAEQVLEGARSYALMSLGKEKQHVKMAQGWLNDGRWADETQPSIPQPPRSGVDAHEHRWMPDGTCLFCVERRGDVNPF